MKSYPRKRVAKVDGRWYIIRVYDPIMDRRSSVRLVDRYATGFYFWRDARDAAFGRDK